LNFDLSFVTLWRGFFFRQKQSSKKHIIGEKVIIRLTFNPKSGLKTILACFQKVNLTRARNPMRKPELNQQLTLQKHLTSMSSRLEPAIWSRDTDQVYGRHVGHLRSCCRCRAHAPRSKTASRDNHEKINSWVSFSFLYEYGAPLGGSLGLRNYVMRNSETNWKEGQTVRGTDQVL